MASIWVCANCGVDCREEREIRDEDGLVTAWTVCAYCGRSELRFKDDGSGGNPPDETVELLCRMLSPRP